MSGVYRLPFLGFALYWEINSQITNGQLFYLGLCLDSTTITVRPSPPRQDADLLVLTLVGAHPLSRSQRCDPTLSCTLWG